MATGTVKRVITDKGFGFIEPDGGGEDLFFHRSALKDGLVFERLEAETRVSFEVGRGAKGPRAEDVRRA